jgi:hypothetical protein
MSTVLDVAMSGLKRAKADSAAAAEGETTKEKKEPAAKQPRAHKGKGVGEKTAEPASSKDLPPAPAAKSAAAKANPAGGGRPLLNGAKLQDLVLTIGELSLVNARELATLKSILVSVCLFSRKVSDKMQDTYKQVTKDYTATCKTLGPEEKASFASVHAFLWLEFLSWDTLKDSTLVAAHLAELNTLANAQSAVLLSSHTMLQSELPEAERKEFQQPDQGSLLRAAVEETVKVFRLSRCWNPSLLRLEVCATTACSQSVVAAMLGLLCSKYGGRIKHGKAPKGKLERKIEKHLGKGKGYRSAAAAAAAVVDSDSDM